MNRSEATDLAVRILGVFQGPNAREWEDELADLDAGRAGTAFQRCKREHERRWLSIAEYLTVYRSLNTEDASTRSECDRCAGSGWVDCGHFVHKGNAYSAAEPCRCTDGQRAAGAQTWRAAEHREFITEAQYEATKPKRTKGRVA
jgi:hypothetical protein